MSNIYVRSTDGSDSDNGSTWALAKATTAGAAAIDAAGDTIWVSQVHNESSASSITLALAGTRASPTRLLCGNDAAEPPTALATGGTITTTGTTNLTISGFVYCYGMVFNPGVTVSNVTTILTLANASGDWQTFEQCDFLVNSGNGGVGMVVGGSTNNKVLFLNCRWKFKNAGNGLQVNGQIHIKGGSIISGSNTSNNFIRSFSTTGSLVLIEDFDFSNLATNFAFVGTNPISYAQVTVRNCKLPASWNGTIAPISAPTRISIYNCDSGNTNYRLWVEDYCGSIKSETTIVLSGGATDGTTHISWKMTSTTNAAYMTVPLLSDYIAVWVPSLGSPSSPKTFTIEILHDSTTNLKDNEVWVDVSYFNSPTSLISGFTSDCKADFVTASADQDTSTATWTTTGLTNPKKQKLVVTFTPERVGFVYCRVALAKPSKTIYVDPQVMVT